jgi:hypothetical protein
LFAGNHAYRSDVWWVIAALIFALSATYLLRRRVFTGAFALTLCAVFVSGALLIQVRSRENPGAPEIVRFTNGDEVLVKGHVTKEGTLHEEDFGEEVQKIDVESEQITADGNASVVRAGLRITVFSKGGRREVANAAQLEETAVLRYGQRVRFFVKLSMPRNFRNPGAFDYEGYLAESGITALGSVKAGDVEILPGFSGNRFELWRTRVHRSLIEKIHALWPAEQAALIDTIMLGDDTFLGRGTKTNFQRTGTYQPGAYLHGHIPISILART